MVFRRWIAAGLVALVLVIAAGCSQKKEPDTAAVPDYAPYLAEQAGELRVVVLVKNKVEEEKRTVNDMVAAMAGRFTPVIYDVNTEEGKKAEEQLEAGSGGYPAYYLFDDRQLLTEGHDLPQIAQAVMDYKDRLSIGGTGG
ncbi:hypothetical protein PghCCS26_59550 [Paenibacillus glycanilyticus]|uniref:Uncharacterized protein n=1 Tax=Paenibacillus glycanilyticus TaxID=126569 RepID=A0ABQ6NXK3_9BACL|nr:hypothetical protein [Paenibacillus glycanilyticus]GMK48825.1 hypothetical protein PghCCS26_59550 [Paenibacillus glycanilyticus]